MSEGSTWKDFWRERCTSIPWTWIIIAVFSFVISIYRWGWIGNFGDAFRRQPVIDYQLVENFTGRCPSFFPDLRTRELAALNASIRFPSIIALTGPHFVALHRPVLALYLRRYSLTDPSQLIPLLMNAFRMTAHASTSDRTWYENLPQEDTLRAFFALVDGLLHPAATSFTSVCDLLEHVQAIGQWYRSLKGKLPILFIDEAHRLLAPFPESPDVQCLRQGLIALARENTFHVVLVSSDNAFTTDLANAGLAVHTRVFDIPPVSDAAAARYFARIQPPGAPASEARIREAVQTCGGSFGCLNLCTEFPNRTCADVIVEEGMLKPATFALRALSIADADYSIFLEILKEISTTGYYPAWPLPSSRHQAVLHQMIRLNLLTLGETFRPAGYYPCDALTRRVLTEHYSRLAGLAASTSAPALTG